MNMLSRSLQHFVGNFGQTVLSSLKFSKEKFAMALLS